jgi:hypothetical protein
MATRRFPRRTSRIVPRRSQYGQHPVDVIEVPVSFSGQPVLTLQVDRNKVSRRWAATADANFYEALSQVVVGWDLVEDDGSPSSLTPETWLGLGLTLRHESELVEQLVLASSTSRAEGNASSASSGATAPAEGSSKPDSQTSPNGSDTSPSPSVSVSQSPT